MSAQFPCLIELPMPILTPRLLIRPIQAGDGPSLHAAINASREHLMRFLPWADTSHQSLADSENYARQSYSRFVARTDISLALLDRTTQALLGGSGLVRMDWAVPRFEVGYWISKDHEGKGLVSEAVNAITRYAFEQLKARRVELRYEKDNDRSRAVAERLGFEYEGCLRQDRFKYKSQDLTDTCIHARLNTAGLPELAVSW